MKFSFERIIDPGSKSSYAAQFGDVERVDAIDPLTVRVILRRPSGGFQNKVAAFNQGWIVSHKAVAELGDKYPLNPVGTGPFAFERWSTGSEVQLAGNPEYFEGKPAFEKLVFTVIKEETAAQSRLQNGEIDVFWALQSAEVIAKLRSERGCCGCRRVADNTLDLALNLAVKPLDDRRVRQALAYGINRRALSRDFYKGDKDEAYSVSYRKFPRIHHRCPQIPVRPRQGQVVAGQAKANGFALELFSVGDHPYDQIIVLIAADLDAIGVQRRLRSWSAAHICKPAKKARLQRRSPG